MNTKVALKNTRLKEHQPDPEFVSIIKRLDQIQEKNKCLRVQFLDWFSDKLLDWSSRVNEISRRIDSPCVIKVEPRKKEHSRAAKEAKEVARLRELLKEGKEREDAYWAKIKTYEQQKENNK